MAGLTKGGTQMGTGSREGHVEGRARSFAAFARRRDRLCVRTVRWADAGVRGRSQLKKAVNYDVPVVGTGVDPVTSRFSGARSTN
jgi:hypothetical protein